MEANPKLSSALLSTPPNTKCSSPHDRSGSPPKIMTPLNRGVIRSRHAVFDTFDFKSRSVDAQSVKNSEPQSTLSIQKSHGQYSYQISRKNASQQHQPRSKWQPIYVAIILAMFFCLFLSMSSMKRMHDMFSRHRRTNTSLRNLSGKRLEQQGMKMPVADAMDVKRKVSEEKALLKSSADVQRLVVLEVIKELALLEETESSEESNGEEMQSLLNLPTSQEIESTQETKIEEWTPARIAEAESNPAHVRPDFNRIVHVIGSRFMQFQPNLTELGRARLELFRHFCLPTIVHQTSKNFLWIIRADPDLDVALKNELVQLLTPYPNFILVASNKFPEGLRDPESVSDMLDPHNVWSGDIELVRAAHSAAQRNIVLETRLDADDGLHNFFVEYVQNDALKHLDRPNEAKDDMKATIEEVTMPLSSSQWRVWCAFSIIEWHAKSPFPATRSGHDSPHGYLVGIADMKCVTPGLTLGYGVNTPRSAIPKAPHHKIHTKMPMCKENGNHRALRETKCLQRLTSLAPAALRTRTPTSAGMSGVVTGTGGGGLYTRMKKQRKQQEPFWNGTETYLHVMKTNAVDTKKYLMEHVAAIAIDNLKGQCTAGHSCKTSTQKLLQKLANTGEGEILQRDELLALVAQNSGDIVEA